MRLVLASGSPRRKEILDLLGLDHEVRPPAVDEELRAGEVPAVQARRLAVEKVTASAADAGELIVAADTLVVLGDEILGKPGDAVDAVRMLMQLQGRRHEVYTGLALRVGGRIESDVASTRVWFRSLVAAECEEYVASGEPLDKAGAYGIQGLGAALVQRIEGEYFNVMGLPVQLLLSLLTRFDLRYAYGSLEAE
ncbi:MAG: septum formation inhibitor Maf [Gemmatimonadetes bacterium]|nr:septum formation inhibitor Maf [Gemmatimonadota bacterium]NNK48527.1 septum formation inhibitor Maf [Gemmatimonadota bacterium]